MADPAIDPFAGLAAPAPVAPAATPATNDNGPAKPGFSPVIDIAPSGQQNVVPGTPLGEPGSGAQIAPVVPGPPSDNVAPVVSRATERREFSDAMNNLGIPTTPPPTATPPAQAKPSQATSPRAAPQAPVDPFAIHETAAAPAAQPTTAAPGTAAAPSTAPAVVPPITTPQTPPGTPPLHPMLQQELHASPWYQPLSDAVQTLQGATDTVKHGLTAGFNEIIAPLLPAIEKSLSQGVPFTQAYDQAQQEQTLDRRQFEALHPAAGTALEMAGSALPATAEAKLFGMAAKGAGFGARAVMAARNVGAGATVGAVQGFGGTDGDLAARTQGAISGAETGGALSAVAPVATSLGAKVASGVLKPMKTSNRIVGDILNETVGDQPGLPSSVKFEPSPIPGAPLDVAQSSGNPELAQLVDTRQAGNLPLVKRMQAKQAQAMMEHIPGVQRNAQGEATNVAPESAAARGSERFTRGVQSGMTASRTEESRVWNTPALKDKNMSSESSKTSVADAIRRIADETPGLHDVLENSAAIRSILKDLDGMPDRVSANELNSIAGRLKTIGRDIHSDDNVRLVAKKLAGAAHEGLWNAPEVTGRLAQTIPGLPARTEMHAQADGTLVPVQIAATPPTVIPAVKPIPSLVKDLNAARAFTRGEAETFGHASFENIVGRNSFGNQTVTAGNAANRFFDFASGTERPGAIQDATRFLNDIKSEWLKLGQLGTKYDPASVSMAQNELKQGLREYISAKLLSGISSTATDLRGNQSISMAKAADFLANNRAMLRNTGIYTDAEMDAWKQVEDYARMVNRGSNLGRAVGSPTFTRLTSEAKWLNIFLHPIYSSIAGVSVGAALGALGGNEAGLGVLLGGLEGGGLGGVGSQIFRAMYNSTREKALAKLDEAISNPVIAADLMRRANAKIAISRDTKQWLRSWLVNAGTEESTRAQQPELVQ
jgi:hypothetical protein